MACGLPVVATRVGAAQELNPKGENGRLVPAGSAQELAQALDFFLSNPAEGRRMGANGRNFIQNAYSLDQTLARLMAVYAELTEEGA
jgi:mannosyltransferase